MAKTRVCQCPKCGTLTATRKAKFAECRNCHRRFKVDKHIVDVPAAVLKDQSPARIAAPEAPRVEAAREAPFTAADLLKGKSGPKGGKMAKDKEGEQTTYKCEDCNGEIQKGQKHCPHCGRALDWTGVE